VRCGVLLIADMCLPLALCCSAAVETFLLLIIVYPLSGLHGGVSSSQFGYCYLMMLLGQTQVDAMSTPWTRDAARRG